MGRIEQGVLDSVSVIDEVLSEIKAIMSQNPDALLPSLVTTIDEVAKWQIEYEEWREEVKGWCSTCEPRKSPEMQA